MSIETNALNRPNSVGVTCCVTHRTIEADDVGRNVGRPSTTRSLLRSDECASLSVLRTFRTLDQQTFART